MEASNTKAIREALEEILDEIDKWRTDNVMERWQYSQLFYRADTALAAPPRQCDVGTVEEQRERHKTYCYARKGTENGVSFGCKDCPLIDDDDCALVWANMPYTESEVGE